MNTFLLAAVALGLVAFLVINRRRQAAAGSAPATESRSRRRARTRSRDAAIQGYPDPLPGTPAAASAEAASTLAPAMEPAPLDPPLDPPFDPPVAAQAPTGASDWGFDEMIVEPGWPLPGEMAGSWPAGGTSPVAQPAAEPAAPAPAPEPAASAPAGEWSVTSPPQGDQDHSPSEGDVDPGPEPVRGPYGAADEPVMEAWVPGVTEVEPVVLPEPEPVDAAAAEPPVAGEPVVREAPAEAPVAEAPLADAGLVWADAPAEPVAQAPAPADPDVPGPPAWEPPPAPVDVTPEPAPAPEPPASPLVDVWEPVPAAVAEAPVAPAEESPWQPAAPPPGPVPHAVSAPAFAPGAEPGADPDAQADELAAALPLAVADLVPLLAASDHDGVTPRMAAVLRALADDPRGLPDLARALGVSRPVVADVCARLEALELVQRLRDPADRRRMLVVPTDEGLRVAEESEPRVDRDALAGALGRMSPAERSALVSAVRALRAA